LGVNTLRYSFTKPLYTFACSEFPVILRILANLPGAMLAPISSTSSNRVICSPEWWVSESTLPSRLVMYAWHRWSQPPDVFLGSYIQVVHGCLLNLLAAIFASTGTFVRLKVGKGDMEDAAALAPPTRPAPHAVDFGSYPGAPFLASESDIVMRRSLGHSSAPGVLSILNLCLSPPSPLAFASQVLSLAAKLRDGSNQLVIFPSRNLSRQGFNLVHPLVCGLRGTAIGACGGFLNS